MERKTNKKTIHHDRKLQYHRNDEEGSSKKPKNTSTNFSNELRVVIKVKSKENNADNHKNNQLAMGDSKNKKTDKSENTAVINVKRTTQSYNDRRISENNNAKTLDLLMRKKLRERYTFKLQNSNPSDSVNYDANKNAIKNEKIDMLRNDKLQKTDSKNNNKKCKKENEKLAKSSEDSGTSVNIFATEHKERQTKSIIRTNTRKNHSTRIYKAVTFVGNEHRKRSTLEISIPNDTYKRSRTRFNPIKKTKSKRLTQSINCTEKSRNTTEKRRETSAVSSPELSLAGSPTQTEVAKWVPASTDQLTKPYYDAWVDKTVAAVFRDEMDDTQKQLILDSIKKTIRDRDLQRTDSLMYMNLKDECYTGTIKIRQREHKHKKANATAVDHW